MITKENIEKLVEIGQLLVYEIAWFDPALWTTTVELRTFNEQYARERFASMQAAGLILKFSSYWVQFNQEAEVKNGN